MDFEGRRILVRPKRYWRPKDKEARAIPMREGFFRLLKDKDREGRMVFTKQDGGQLKVHSIKE